MDIVVRLGMVGLPVIAAVVIVLIIVSAADRHGDGSSTIRKKDIGPRP